MSLPGNTKYLVNLLESHIQMMDNRLTVKRGDFIPITDKEAEHEDVIFAIRRGWARLDDKAPSEPAVAPAPEVTFGKPAIQGASSIEELLGKEPAKEPEVTSTPVSEAEPEKEAAPATSKRKGNSKAATA